MYAVSLVVFYILLQMSFVMESLPFVTTLYSLGN